MVVHAVVDEGDGERGPHLFSRLYRAGQSPLLLPGDSSSVPEPPARCFLAEHAGHSHVLLATFEKVRAGLGPPVPSCPLPAPAGCWRELGEALGLFWGGPEARGLIPGVHPVVFPSPARRRYLLREATQAEASGECAASPGRSGDPRAQRGPQGATSPSSWHRCRWTG